MDRRHLMLDLRPMPEPVPVITRSVRHPTVQDGEALAILMLDAYDGTTDSDGTETLADARDEVQSYLSGAPMLAHSFVALDGDQPIAAALVSRHDGIGLIAYVIPRPDTRVGAWRAP